MNNKIITICREFGAEGHEIGMKLSERLSIPIYDKDLLMMSVKASGIQLNKAARADENIKRGLLSSYMYGKDNEVNDEIFYTERKIIQQLAERESCIIVGRLADYILRDRKDSLKILVYAPFDARIQIISQKRNITREQASRLVRQMDLARNNYYSYYSDGKWEHHTGKDLMLNRQTLGIEGCVTLIESAYQLEHYQ